MSRINIIDQQEVSQSYLELIDGHFYKNQRIHAEKNIILNKNVRFFL